MLAEERFLKILSIIEKDGSATVQELMASLGASESTIRRDLTTMDANGLLLKVHGGAVAKKVKMHTFDEEVINRKNRNIEEKRAIAKYAASLINDYDFVYLDAGTTTELMTDYIKAKNTIFVTNAIGHAKKLSALGFRVFILGGEFKSMTEAIVGEEAVATLDKYNFTKGFWGTNGVDLKTGFTTPEIKEAMVKKKSMENCKERFVLADSDKFSQISSIKFADFDTATILTANVKEERFLKNKNIKEVKLE